MEGDNWRNRNKNKDKYTKKSSKVVRIGVAAKKLFGVDGERKGRIDFLGILNFV